MGRPPLLISPGEKYGKLTVIKRQGYYGGGYGYLCQCACGTQKVAGGTFLKRGKIVSCGCAHRGAASLRKAPGEAVANARYGRCKYWAKSKDLPFNLTIDRFLAIVQMPCHYCGTPPQPKRYTEKWGAFVCHGLDRANNSLGYVPGNAVPCCKHCNWAKSNMTVQQFTDHVQKVWAHSASKLEKSTVG
jgi:hypothetical protein